MVLCFEHSTSKSLYMNEAYQDVAGVLGGVSATTEADNRWRSVETRLLVLHHKLLVVAIPLQLAAHTYASAIQAKNAVIHHVLQLTAFTDMDWLQKSV